MPLNKLRRYRHIILTRRKLRKEISSVQNLKLHIGTGAKSFNGWINLDLPYFDLRSNKLWDYLFRKASIDNILLEHVLEHLTPEEVNQTLTLAKDYLKKTGVIRIAVPDKNHPNPDYIDHVKPNGTGAGSDDHKSFWNFDEFNTMCISLGLQCTPMEYYDESRKLTMGDLNETDGVITRTARKKRTDHLSDYSSLIIDIRLKD